MYPLTLCFVILPTLLLQAGLVGSVLYDRSFDGRNNNELHPDWGAAGTPHHRLQVPIANYINGTLSDTFPNPRVISNILSKVGFRGTPQNNIYLNELHTYFAQFIVLDSTNTMVDSQQPDNIPVPSCDPWYDIECSGNASIPFQRYAHVNDSPAPLNVVSHFYDLSVIYGNDNSSFLKWMNESTGELRLDLEMTAVDNRVLPRDHEWIITGDTRFNEDPGVMTVGTLFIREHNRRVAQLRKDNASITPIEAFLEARRMTIGIYQKIVSREYLSSTIGQPLRPYLGYNNSVDPSTDIFVSTVSFRYGHSGITNKFARVDPETGTTITEGDLSVLTSLFAPSDWKIKRGPLCRHSNPELFLGLSTTLAADVDVGYTDEVRHFTFGTLTGGVDLLAVDIQRGRDLGIPDYNTCRQSLGLPKVTNFSQITSNEAIAQALLDLYQSVDNIDAIVGLFAEDHIQGLAIGPLTQASLRDEFRRKRDGDRYWYENGLYFTTEEITEILGTTLKQLFITNFPEINQDVLSSALPNSPFYINSRQIGVYGGGVLWSSIPSTVHLDMSPAYRLSWSINSEDQTITLIIQTTTKGWVGVGFDSKPNTMKDADILLCRSFPNGTAQCLDCYALDVGEPTRDVVLGGTDDILDYTFEQSEFGSQTITILRKLVTGDSWDKEIGKNQQKILYAYNPKSTQFLYHGPTRSYEVVDMYNLYIQSLPPKVEPYPALISWIVIILSVIGVSLSVFFLIITLSNNEYFLHLTPTFCYMILFGTFLGYSSVFVGLFPVSDVMCSVQIWLMGLSYMFIFPCLYVRVYRVWLISTSAKKLKKLQVTVSQILLPVIVGIAVEVIFLLVWTFVGPPQLVELQSSGTNALHMSCFHPEPKQDAFWVVFIVSKVILLCLGIYLGIVSRKVEKSLNESRHIAYCIYVTGVVAFVFTPTGFLLSLVPEVTMLISTIGLVVPYLFTTVVLFIEPTIAILTGQSSTAQRIKNRHTVRPSQNIPTEEFSERVK